MIANTVWECLGQPKHYIEPFFGSGAVLLNRPGFEPGKHIETVNDKDGFISNVWRSLKYSPDETAQWCDWPVNHADLMARKAALIKNEDRLLENLIQDDEWHDPKMAGYWIWAASCWIGSGLTRPGQRPHLGHAGTGVNAGQRPHLGHAGTGINAGQRPHLSHARSFGMGIHSVRYTKPKLSLDEPYNIKIYEWFRELAERLRYVRVVCGDWKQVCGGNWQDKMGTVGIFFDPPYGAQDRDKGIYHHDSTTISLEVEAWCLERGNRPTYRIVCAGYEGEYLSLIEAGWKVIAWKANGGYSNTGNNKQGKANTKRERLFISPHCGGQQAMF